MKLPKVTKPLFNETLPSTGEKLTLVPFVTREEKILLMAQQSGLEKDIVMALKQIITNCVQNPGFKISKLTTFDLEYLFLRLRAKSVNNIIEVSYQDAEDGKVYDFEIDLDEVQMLKPATVDKKIEITDTIGIIMKYPSVSVLDNAPDDATAAEIVDYLIRNCVDQIYDEENVYPAKDITDEELSDWLDDLDTKSFNKIKEFFDGMPQMYYKISYTNSLGNERVIELTSLSDFFTWG